MFVPTSTQFMNKGFAQYRNVATKKEKYVEE